MKNIIVLLFIILLCCIFNKFTFEKYEDYDPDEELPYNLQQYQNSNPSDEIKKVFNDNYDAAWLKPQVAHNNPNITNYAIDELTHGMGDFNQEKSIHTPYIHYDLLKNIINDFNINHTLGYNKFDEIIRNKERFPNKLIQVSDDSIKKLNAKTWINRYDYNANDDLIFKYIKSDLDDLNQINNEFIINFNNIFKKYYNKDNKIKFFKYEPFYIYKYRINKYYKKKDDKNVDDKKKDEKKDDKNVNDKNVNDKKNDKKKDDKNVNDKNVFEINIILLRNHSTHGIHLYLTSFYDKNNLNDKSHVFNKSLSLIGEDSLDKLLISKGYNNETEFNLIDSINNDGFLKNIDDKYKKRITVMKKNIDLKSQYNCFDINNPNKIIEAQNKVICENEFDWYGRPKDIGIWDRPCKSDKECLFNQSNQNYDNKYGKCLENGKCELPLNNKSIGYHYKTQDSKSLCYNCNPNQIDDTGDNIRWEHTTKLDTCCEKQDKTSNEYNDKYDFLDGPDYAFSNDDEDRINAYNKKLFREKKKYIKYDIKNIFGDFADTYSTFLE
jgi:hypothetical protein